ncbi:cobalamin biosynthesis protein CobQ [Steroidobacter denitrificans]|uniref:Cobyric acid synthase n=1 Tax=Steroidobacter denitrificans TaxID=465721 RepID=A0A127FEQ2_STEDE|nr:cobyric acid synthase [Steroidobacter denitrificans]AMN48409.1 cobalamin biosynthesis protein CobQ [Steroidobacter denitrificans]
MAAVMFQGTGSDVGKSVIVAGVCRALVNRGLTVRPFKPQNMSNNAAVAADGGEIGRAQALQAIACRVPASVHMNPVLIKPQSDIGAQLVIRGVVRGTVDAGYFRQHKAELLEIVLESFGRLSREADIVVVEGAGSPAESNLRAHDIANMGFARAARVPVVLIGDIDRGGVIAALVGTSTLLSRQDRAMIKAFIINKFRGDISLFESGVAEITRRTSWPSLGVVPWLAAARTLPAEDAVTLNAPAATPGALRIVVPLLPHIANFDDFDALMQDSGASLQLIPPGTALPGDAKVVIIPGTKATIADLKFLRRQGWDIDIAAHVRRGGHVVGICGGFQMLGSSITDPEGMEGPVESVDGLDLLPMDTYLMKTKQVGEVRGIHIDSGAVFDGYEIHAGQTRLEPGLTPWLRFDDGSAAGAIRADGLVAGCYVHGLYNRAEFRGAWLESLGVSSDRVQQHQRIDAALDELAAVLERSVDLDRLLDIARCSA